MTKKDQESIIRYVADTLHIEHDCMKAGLREKAEKANYVKLGAVHVAAIALGTTSDYVLELAVEQLRQSGYEFYLQS